MSCLVTKPTKWLCAQWRPRSAWASTQSDQSLRCAGHGQLRTQAFFMQTGKTLIRLGGCPGWSESSLGAHAILLVLSQGGSYMQRQLTTSKQLSMIMEHNAHTRGLCTRIGPTALPTCIQRLRSWKLSYSTLWSTEIEQNDKASKHCFCQISVIAIFNFHLTFVNPELSNWATIENF